MKIVQFSLAFLAVMISLLGQGIVKMALNRVRLQIAAQGAYGLLAICTATLLNPLFWTGLLTIVLGAFVYFALLYSTPITKALPAISGIGYVMLFAFGHFMLKETISPIQLLGLVLLVGGMILISK